MARSGKERRYGIDYGHRERRPGEHTGGGRKLARFMDLVQTAFMDGLQYF